MIYRYNLNPKESAVLADFLMQILKWDPKERATAQQMLEHPWFSMADDYNTKMSEMEFKLYELRDQTQTVENYQLDYATLMEERANLMGGQTQGHRKPPGDLRDIEHLKRQI